MAENRCPTCQGKFGMMRHYIGSVGYCRQRCKDDELKQRQQRILQALHLKDRPPDQYELPLQKPPEELIALLRYP